MKRLMLGLALPLVVIGCAKVERNLDLEPNRSGSSDRMAVSQTENLKDNARRLEKDKTNFQEDIDKACDKLVGDINDYNTEVTRRNAEYADLSDQQGVLYQEITTHQKEHRFYLGKRSKLYGEADEILKFAVNRTGTVKDFVKDEIKRLKKLRSDQERDWKQATRQLSRIDMRLAAYDPALMVQETIDANIMQTDASMAYVMKIKAANYAFNSTQELARLPALNNEASAANDSMGLVDVYLVPLRTALEVVSGKIAALPTNDHLETIQAPSQCVKLF